MRVLGTTAVVATLVALQVGATPANGVQQTSTRPQHYFADGKPLNGIDLDANRQGDIILKQIKAGRVIREATLTPNRYARVVLRANKKREIVVKADNGEFIHMPVRQKGLVELIHRGAGNTYLRVDKNGNIVIATRKLLVGLSYGPDYNAKLKPGETIHSVL
jgi:hypothetical protein